MKEIQKDPEHPYKDLLVITIVGPEGQVWKQRGVAVPRVGEKVVCVGDTNKDPLDVIWEGVVTDVFWCIVEGSGGQVVNVQTKPWS